MKCSINSGIKTINDENNRFSVILDHALQDLFINIQLSSSSSTKIPSQVLPSTNPGNGDTQNREAEGGGNFDFPISTNTRRSADELHSGNHEDEVVQNGEAPSMSFFQGSSNIKIQNSNFNEIHGNAKIIRFGDGQFTEAQRTLICDYIANLAILPDIHESLNKTSLIQPIINLPHAEAVFDDYQTKKKSGPCFEGTRVALLREMAEWVTGSDESRIYVLSGLAGIGKSTVAYTIASRAANLNLLGASFFFSRDEGDRKNAKKIFTTIAYQLCVYNETFAKAIGEVLETQRGSAAIAKGPQEQLQALIVVPLQSIVQSRARPILVVVDALDECDEEDALSVLIGLKQLVRALPSFKVVLTTRPHPHLDRFFGCQDGHEIFHMQNIGDKVVDGDIRLYLDHMLSVEKVQEHLPTSQWCASDNEVDALARAAGRLFIIASTTVRMILDKITSNPAAQMEKLLGTFAQAMPFKNLNEFYTVVLRNVVLADCDDNIVSRYQSVVGTIIFVQYPLPITTLAHLIDIDMKEIRAVLISLRSLILLGDDDIPRIYHKSFPEYITNSNIRQDINLRIDPIMRHMQITICCFQIMDKHLKRNILGLSEPARFMSNEHGLKEDGITDEQIQDMIPEQLRYACVYWVDHLKVANLEDEGLMNGLERFAYQHMLYWLEVLSLIGKLDSAHRTIGVVLKLLSSTSSELHQLFSDALHFISLFYDIIERSALHIYHSALPFTPTDGLLYRRYIKEAEHNMCTIEGGPKKWNTLVANLTHGEHIQGIKFSIDSTLFTSCSCECVDENMNAQGMLKIWDAARGTPISTIPGQRFAVTNNISTVVSSQDNVATFYNVNGSPNGTIFTTSSKIETLALSSESSRVAAGLSNGIVWIWDSESAELIDRFDGFGGNGQLKFSPCGTRLAYSWMHGFRLRDGISGRFVTDIRCGPSDQFEFSADGSRIACRGHDVMNNLTLWKSKSGKVIATGRNVGHHAFAISANGSLLATAHRDKVTLWGETRGARDLLLAKIKVLQVDGPLSISFSLDNILAIVTRSGIKLFNVKTHAFIHTLPLGGWSIPPGFSPDCTRLATGDRDGNVNLWDIRSINTSGPLLKGNAIPVTALALSRNCSRLACGFGDGTVELWGTSPTNFTKRRIGPLTLRSKVEKIFFRIFRQSRHTESVRALEFDPDGRLLASGSGDGTIKLWNGGDGLSRGTLKAPGTLQAVALSNSVLVAACGRCDGNGNGGVTLWNLDTLSPIHTFKKPDGTAFKVTIAENSTVIAVCFRRSLVTLFDAVNCTAIRTFDVRFDIHTMTFLPDNSHLVLQSDESVFRSFDLINNRTIEGPTLKHLVQLPTTPLWHDVPIWHCEEKEQHYFAALFSEDRNPVSVLWIPKQIPVVAWVQGSSMIALGCNNGRVILLRLPTSHVS